MKTPQPLSSKAQSITDIMVMIFRLNGRLLDRGDELVESLNITSARWQLLGAAHLANRPLTAPQIAESMGVSRQGAQKQLDKMAAEGFFESQVNPHHARSPLYSLTLKGRQTIAQAMHRQTLWSSHLARGWNLDCLTQTLSSLETLYVQLDSPISSQGTPQ